MKFRLDIQILRGLAVLYVVLFHLGFYSIKSGFLGVDVFFVISGFLMASLYDNNNKKEFIYRRARRLLPSYFVVIFVTLFISLIINTPNESNQVVNQAIFGSAFISNIGFWLQNSYFSKAEFNPLLHLWSLGVEIQFYLLVPLLSWFFSKARFTLIFTMLLSLVLCFIVLTISPKTSFFMMPLRLWEFLLGYGSALCFTSFGQVKVKNYTWLGLIGLILIVSIPFFNVDGESLSIISGHPGLMSLLVAISTLLVLVFGIPLKIEESLLSKLLILLGKYSYAIYLIHFPVIVLYLSEPFSGTMLNVTDYSSYIALFVLICTLSIILHKYIENRKFHMFKFTFILLSLIFSLAMLGPKIKDNLISEKERNIFNAFQDRSTYRCGKLFRFLNPTELTCNLSGDFDKKEIAIMLVGNSHADSIKTTFTRVAAENGQVVYFFVKNNPLMRNGASPEVIVRESLSKGVKHIVLHFSPSGIVTSNLKELVNLAENYNIKITLLEPVPTWRSHIPKMMYENLMGTGHIELQTKDDYLLSNAELFKEVGSIKNSNFNRVSVVDYFCEPDCIYQSKKGVPLYFDGGHLTLTGSYRLVEAIDKAIDYDKR